MSVSGQWSRNVSTGSGGGCGRVLLKKGERQVQIAHHHCLRTVLGGGHWRSRLYWHLLKMKPSPKNGQSSLTRCSVSLIFTELHIKTKVRKFPGLKWRHKDSTLPPTNNPFSEIIWKQGKQETELQIPIIYKTKWHLTLRPQYRRKSWNRE